MAVVVAEDVVLVDILVVVDLLVMAVAVDLLVMGVVAEDVMVAGGDLEGQELWVSIAPTIL